MIISQTNSSGFNSPQASDVSTPQRSVVRDADTATAVRVDAPVPAKAVQAAVATPSPDQVKQAVEHLNKFVQTMTNDVRFTVDQDTGMQVVKVVDIKTKDVICQYPSETVLAIAKSLDTLKGMLIRQKA